MSADSLALLIAGATGASVGGFIVALVMGALAERKARRAEKDAWKSANIYFSRKANAEH